MRFKTYSGNQFRWHNGEGCTCASDLGLRAGEWPAGFYVRSQRTGVLRLFIPGEETFSQDGEFVAKKYFVPAGNCVITLFND